MQAGSQFGYKFAIKKIKDNELTKNMVKRLSNIKLYLRFYGFSWDYIWQKYICLAKHGSYLFYFLSPFFLENYERKILQHNIMFVQSGQERVRHVMVDICLYWGKDKFHRNQILNQKRNLHIIFFHHNHFWNKRLTEW